MNSPSLWTKREIDQDKRLIRGVILLESYCFNTARNKWEKECSYWQKFLFVHPFEPCIFVYFSRFHDIHHIGPLSCRFYRVTEKVNKSPTTGDEKLTICLTSFNSNSAISTEGGKKRELWTAGESAAKGSSRLLACIPDCLSSGVNINDFEETATGALACTCVPSTDGQGRSGPHANSIAMFRDSFPFCSENDFLSLSKTSGHSC